MAVVTDGYLAGLFTAIKMVFNNGMSGAPAHWRKIAMEVQSGTREENYTWLADLPRLREWIGERVVHGLSTHNYAVVNKLFEATIAVKRVDIEDDRNSIYAPLFETMGRDAGEHPDELIFDLLRAGFSTRCYDGQYFFDMDHPVGVNGLSPVTSRSNMQAGSGTPWFLLDCSRPIKPLLFQKRLPYELQKQDAPNDERVFWKDEYVYGVRARGAAGFGLWQLAFGSKAPLTAGNYETARQAMMTQTDDHGMPLGVRPTHLVFGAAHEKAALTLLNATSKVESVDNGSGGTASVVVSNIWAGTVEPVLSARIL